MLTMCGVAVTTWAGIVVGSGLAWWVAETPCVRGSQWYGVPLMATAALGMFAVSAGAVETWYSSIWAHVPSTARAPARQLERARNHHWCLAAAIMWGYVVWQLLRLPALFGGVDLLGDSPFAFLLPLVFGVLVPVLCGVVSRDPG